MIDLAIDVGYATTKFAVRDPKGDKIISNRFFSLVGTADRIFHKEKLPPLSMEYGHITFLDRDDKNSFYIHTLTKHSNVPLPILYKDWIKDTPFLVLARAAMGIALRKSGISDGQKFSADVNIVTGLPVEYFTRQQDVREISGVLTGRHKFRLDNCDFDLNVTCSEDNVLPQPSGAYHDILLTDASTFNPDFLDYNFVGIVDVGNSTTDLAIFDEDEYMSSESTSKAIGVSKFFNSVINKIAIEYDVRLTPSKVESMIRSGDMKVSVKGSRVDVSSIVDCKRRESADAICYWISSVWASRNSMDGIFVAGGGADVFRNEILQHFPEAKFVSDGTKSNVKGYLKWFNFLERVKREKTTYFESSARKASATI